MIRMTIQIDDDDWVNWAIIENGEDVDDGDVIESGNDPFDAFIDLLKEIKDNK